MPPLPVGASHFTQLWNGKNSAWNDPSSYTKIARRESEKAFKSDRELTRAFVPASDIKRAREVSIFEYCKQNKIALTKDPEGRTVLKGKEFVSVSEFEFTNTKNGTRGSLIDLVAAHKNMTLLQSVAHINDNPRLLLLEHYAGQVPLKFKSFHVPKPEKSAPEKISGTLQTFFRAANTPSGISSSFHANRIEHLGSQSAVWLFLKSKPSPESFAPPLPQSARNLQRQTAAQRPGGSSHKAARHEQAIGSGVLQHQSALFVGASVSTLHGTHSIDHEIIRAIDLFLIANPGAKKLNLCSLLPADHGGGESQMFSFLKKRYDGFAIDVCDVSTEHSLDKALTIESPALGRRSPGRGMDFGF
jgi:hypothetical protein